MKVHETTWKKQGSRSTSYKRPDIKESADFIIDQYGCRYFWGCQNPCHLKQDVREAY